MSIAYRILFNACNPYWNLIVCNETRKLVESLDVKMITTEKDHGHWIEKHEVIDGKQYGTKDITMKNAYSKLDGGYIGDVKWAKLLDKKGITKIQKRSSDHDTCSIGFNEKENKWYGWSHRAMYGFGVGSKVKEGDVAFKPNNKEAFVQDITRFWKEDHENFELVKDTKDPNKEKPGMGVLVSFDYKNSKLGYKGFHPYPKKWGNGEWEAKTMADALEMAKDFADGVS